MTTTAAVHPRARAALSVPAPAAAALARALERAVRFPDDALVRLAVPAPVAPAAALLRGGADGVVWESRDGAEAWAGLGQAAVVTGAGPDRFATVAAAARAIDARTAAVDAPPPARWLGGFAFTPGGASAGAWAGFGDARFVLPRWTYARHGERAELILCAPAGQLADAAAIHAELATVLSLLATPCPAPGASAVAQRDAAVATWCATVEAARAAIAAGHLRKVVAARARWIELAQAVDPAALVAELGRRQPACTRFAFSAGGATFVGASPERLVRKRGRALDTEALAGSWPRIGADADADATALLASAKDRGEHAWVVEAIERALAPRCARLTIPNTPTVRVLPHLVHLHTPVVGELDRDRHVLELVAALHPTPAVGGTPTDDAVAWIAAHEESARGWYAAPVGWFDATGDGEFAVAIRSGLVAGTSVALYAGAGLVDASDPLGEWRETELKLAALTGALGIER